MTKAQSNPAVETATDSEAGVVASTGPAGGSDNWQPSSVVVVAWTEARVVDDVELGEGVSPGRNPM
jgi:hypothetical protein